MGETFKLAYDHAVRNHAGCPRLTIRSPAGGAVLGTVALLNRVAVIELVDRPGDR
jgi:hypothetical protein